MTFKGLIAAAVVATAGVIGSFAGHVETSNADNLKLANCQMETCNIVGFKTLNQPIVNAAMDNNTGGLWLLGGDGGVFTTPGTPFYGSAVGLVIGHAVMIVPTQDGGGYYVIDSSGDAFPFGDAVSTY